ncbi:MAG: hypothetical protein NVSMB30_12190 [Hymenobacter sp.]
MFEQTPASIAILQGPAHRFEYVNPAYQRLFPGRELRGRTLAEVLPEAAAHGFLALLDGVYQTGETYFGQELLLPITQPDGQPPKDTYFDFTYQPVREKDELVGITIFAHDVTERVLARRQWAAQQEQLKALFEQAPVAIAIIQGPEHIIEVANRRVAQLWGRTPAQLLGKPVLEALPEVRDQGFIELLDQVLATGEAFVAEEIAVMLERPNGLETVYLNFVYQPLLDASGLATSVAAVATDVSPQVAARQQLSRANAALTAANQQVSARAEELAAANRQLLRTNQDLDNFVYAASHDLKQPVNNLAGLFEELRYATAFANTEEENLLVPMVNAALHQLSATINDLAAVGQVQHLPDLPPETVDLAELTQEVLQTLQPQALAARARITTDFAARPTISYARANLRTILLNLLSNAFKYADPARPARVHLSLWLQEDRPVLLVEDNGLGFDVHRHQDELFHLFRRFHDHTEGTGVGLYLVNRIVQGHGGRIEVESEVGEGTSFRVFL